MSLYEAVKDAARVAQKADNIELYQKILDLQAEALDEQEAKALMTSKIRDLEARVSELSVQLLFSKSLTYDQNSQCYRVEGEGNTAGAHICSRCWDVRKIAVRLRDYRNGFWGCPECESTVKVSSRAY